MEFSDAVRARRMTRNFSTEPVEEALLDRLLSLSLRAPTAGSAEGVELLVLTLARARAQFWEAIGDEAWRRDPARSQGLTRAPVIVLPCADPEAYLARYAKDDKATSSLAGLDAGSWPVPYWSIDAAFAAMTLLLGATDAGLGALFFHLQGRERALLRAFDIPESVVTIGAIAIGTVAHDARRDAPATRPRPPRPRVHRERW